MKRWAIGSIAFLATLAIGIVLVWPTLIEQETQQTILPSPNPEEITLLEPQEDSFVPEFRDLPNLEEVDYPQAGEHLIDLHQVDGVYRESEVMARTGQNWLVFADRDGKYFLEYSKAKVKRLSTTSYPGDEKDVILTFDKLGKTILAFRNFKPLRPGKVTTVYLRPTTDEIDRRNLPIGAMEDSYSQDFNLDDSWYTLRASKGIQKDGTKVGVLVMEHGDEKQVIDMTQHFPGESIIIGNLLWVGDLDNDRKLDVYLDRYDEKGGYGGYLFLSSEAESGKLVKLVATWGLAGC